MKPKAESYGATENDGQGFEKARAEAELHTLFSRT